MDVHREEVRAALDSMMPIISHSGEMAFDIESDQ
jgi:hypothetical protein